MRAGQADLLRVLPLSGLPLLLALRAAREVRLENDAWVMQGLGAWVGILLIVLASAIALFVETSPDYARVGGASQ